MSAIRAVLFDAAGTLLRVKPSPGAAYAREAARFGVSVDAEDTMRAFKAQFILRRPSADGATPFHTSEAVERAWWRGLVEAVFHEMGVLEQFEGRFDAYFESLYDLFADPSVWHVFDDVIPTLDALEHANVIAAVVSNWDSRLPRLLKSLKLRARFAFVLTSAEAGYSKPHPAIFTQAVERLGLRVEDVLHVGDSLEEDIAGAGAAGVKALHLDRKAEVSARGTIKSLREVLRRF